MQNKKIVKKEKAFVPRHCPEPNCPDPTKLFKSRRTLYKHRKEVHTVPKTRGVVPRLSEEQKKENRRAIDKARTDARRKARTSGKAFKTERTKRSSSTETAASQGLPLKTIKVLKKGFTEAEPSGTIGALPWRASMSPEEAYFEMATEKFWHEVIDNHYDPIWVYRYLRWRLGHPSLAGVRLIHG